MDLTRFEITRIISARAFQISLGAPLFTKSQKEDSAYVIAKREFEEKKLPYAIMRTTPSGKNIIVGG